MESHTLLDIKVIILFALYNLVNLVDDYRSLTSLLVPTLTIGYTIHRWIRLIKLKKGEKQDESQS